MKSTWTRLEDGTWGIRVEAQQGALLDNLVGQEVDVERSDGSVSKQLVTSIAKRIDPRPEKRVGRRVFPGIALPLAICAVEPRPQAAFKKAPAGARKARRPSYIRGRALPAPVKVAEFWTESTPESAPAAQAPAVSDDQLFAALLERPYVTTESTL
jgi:hypothetical protein